MVCKLRDAEVFYPQVIIIKYCDSACMWLIFDKTDSFQERFWHKGVHGVKKNNEHIISSQN